MSAPVRRSPAANEWRIAYTVKAGRCALRAARASALLALGPGPRTQGPARQDVAGRVQPLLHRGYRGQSAAFSLAEPRRSTDPVCLESEPGRRGHPRPRGSAGPRWSPGGQGPRSRDLDRLAQLHDMGGPDGRAARGQRAVCVGRLQLLPRVVHATERGPQLREVGPRDRGCSRCQNGVRPPYGGQSPLGPQCRDPRPQLVEMDRLETPGCYRVRPGRS